MSSYDYGGVEPRYLRFMSYLATSELWGAFGVVVAVLGVLAVFSGFWVWQWSKVDPEARGGVIGVFALLIGFPLMFLGLLLVFDAWFEPL